MGNYRVTLTYISPSVSTLSEIIPEVEHIEVKKFIGCTVKDLNDKLKEEPSNIIIRDVLCYLEKIDIQGLL